MKYIKLNLTQRPSLYRIGKTDYQFDGNLSELFTADEVIHAYEIISEIGNEDVVMASPLFHLFKKAYPEKNDELSLSEHSAKLSYTLYSPLQDALLRFVTSRALELADAIPVRDKVNESDRWERFIDAFDLLSRKYKSLPNRILPLELLSDSKNDLWKIMYKLLSDRKMYSADMSAANFSDWVEQYAIESIAIDHSKIAPEFFDTLSNDQTFKILKVSRIVEHEVPYLETKTKNPYTLMAENKVLGGVDKSFQRFVNISSYSAIGIDLAQIADKLLTDDKEDLLNWSAIKSIPPHYKQKERSELNFDF